jgi:hypothetical protein
MPSGKEYTIVWNMQYYNVSWTLEQLYSYPIFRSKIVKLASKRVDILFYITHP